MVSHLQIQQCKASVISNGWSCFHSLAHLRSFQTRACLCVVTSTRLDEDNLAWLFYRVFPEFLSSRTERIFPHLPLFTIQSFVYAAPSCMCKLIYIYVYLEVTFDQRLRSTYKLWRREARNKVRSSVGNRCLQFSSTRSWSSSSSSTISTFSTGFFYM